MPASYADLTARLARYLAAEQNILTSQEYTVGQGGAARKNRRAELDSVREEIRLIQLDVDKHPDNPAARGARRIRYLRPMG